MGQIKNIKLHIVTDIKTTQHSMPFQARNARSLLTNARVWYQLDARDQQNGKLAAYIVSVLLGDHVVVVNCKDVGILGERQWEHKIYRHHTGFPGGFREMKARDVWRQDPCQILWRAVRGMHPKTRTRNRNMKRLHLFEDDQHPFVANIYAKLEGPAPMPRRLDEYTQEEIENYPTLWEPRVAPAKRKGNKKLKGGDLAEQLD